MDRVNTFLAKTFNKGFRADFNEWKESTDTYTISKNPSAKESLVDATPMQLPNAGENNAFAVDYNRGFGAQDASNPVARWTIFGAGLPFKLGIGTFKLGIGIPTGIGVGLYNLFAKTDVHWGMQFRWSAPMREGDTWGANLLSFGFGDYSHYDMIGRPRERSFFNLVCSPRDGLIGLRVGISPKMAVNYIDILPRMGGGQLHINAVQKGGSGGVRKRSARTGGDQHVIDFFEPPWRY